MTATAARQPKLKMQLAMIDVQSQQARSGRHAKLRDF